MESSQQKIKVKILDFALKNAAFDGWNEKLLENAGISVGLEAKAHKIHFPGGVADLFAFYVDELNRKMAAEAKLDGLKTHEKIKALILLRLEHIKPHRGAIKTLLKAMALNPITTMKATYSAVDSMWRAAGDTSTDFNFYTKRTILAGVYSATVLHFIDDKSDNNENTMKFLDNRLAEVGKFNKFMSGVKEKFKV